MESGWEGNFHGTLSILEKMAALKKKKKSFGINMDKLLVHDEIKKSLSSACITAQCDVLWVLL